MLPTTEQLVDALCIAMAGTNEKNRAQYDKSMQMIRSRADYLDLLKQKERIEWNISYYENEENE